MKLKSKVRDAVESGTVEVETGDGENQDRKRINLSIALSDLSLLLLGALITALGVAIFIAPHDIAPGGATGAAIIITEFITLPLGMTMLAINIPAYLLGYRRLGGTPFLIRSLIATVTYNVAVDLIQPWIPAGGLTDEMILNAVFGGIIGGAGVGLIYRAGGTAGAGGVLTRLLRQWRGWPIKMNKLITNSAIIVAAGFVFSWEAAMYAVISFLVSGTMSDFILEGPDVVQTALIITDRPDGVIRAIVERLDRGVTRWPVRGGHTDHAHTALYCTVSRPQISALKQVVAQVDGEAFMIVFRSHEAVGQGFKAHERQPPIIETVRPASDTEEAGNGYRQD